ncbi:MAG: hypothetical protein WEB31_03410 [Chthoniobacterales bacterium]
MRKPKHWSQPATRVHLSLDDRSRSWAGKTVESKVRSEGRLRAALERSANVRQIYQAAAAKKNPR